MSLSQLTPADLDAFVSVAQTGSFRRSAALLEISQSTISARISRLEAVLGVTLFQRSTRRVAITDAGEQFRRRVVTLIVETRALLQEFKDEAHLKRGQIILGATPSVAAGLLPEVIGRFQRLWPGIDIVLHDDFFGQALDRVMRGEVDIAIVPIESNNSEFICEPLVTDVFRLAVAASHRFAARESITLQEIAHERLMSMPSESAAWATLARAFSSNGLDFSPIFKTRDSVTMISLVRHDFGVALVPKMLSSVINMDGIVLIPVSDADLTRTIGIVRVKNFKLSRAVRAFHKQLMALRGLAA